MLIRAIQESSFNSLGNIQQQMLDDMKALTSSIQRFGNEAKALSTTKPSPSKQSSSQPKDLDCSILNDGQRSSDLSIDNPEKFQDLINRCGG